MVCLNCAMGGSSEFRQWGSWRHFVLLSSIIFHRGPCCEELPREAIQLLLEGVHIRIYKETYSHVWLSRGSGPPVPAFWICPCVLFLDTCLLINWTNLHGHINEVYKFSIYIYRCWSSILTITQGLWWPWLLITKYIFTNRPWSRQQLSP